MIRQRFSRFLFFGVFCIFSCGISGACNAQSFSIHSNWTHQNNRSYYISPGYNNAVEIENYLAAVRQAGLVAEDVEIRKADLEDVFLDVMAEVQK